MKENTTDRAESRPAGRAAASQTLVTPLARLQALYAQSNGAHWGLACDHFASALERSSQKRLASGNLAPEKLDEYLASLHLEDLALASACMESCEPAWEHFVTAYRPYLRTAAAAVLRCSSASAEACELADSLFAELYGLTDGARRERSLFRYFHGRSSLKTWLRAVLAQRHIDLIRANRRFESLEVDDSQPIQRPITPQSQTLPLDPHRERYIELFSRALHAALQQLDSRDHDRLGLYYVEEQTLAAIGERLGEHESSVSRNLDRIRLALRR